jgi:hypothetical protein
MLALDQLGKCHYDVFHQLLLNPSERNIIITLQPCMNSNMVLVIEAQSHL